MGIKVTQSSYDLSVLQSDSKYQVDQSSYKITVDELKPVAFYNPITLVFTGTSFLSFLGTIPASFTWTFRLWRESSQSGQPMWFIFSGDLVSEFQTIGFVGSLTNSAQPFFQGSDGIDSGSPLAPTLTLKTHMQFTINKVGSTVRITSTSDPGDETLELIGWLYTLTEPAVLDYTQGSIGALDSGGADPMMAGFRLTSVGGSMHWTALYTDTAATIPAVIGDYIAAVKIDSSIVFTQSDPDLRPRWIYPDLATAPVAQPTLLTFANITTTSMDLNWVACTCDRYLVLRSTSPITAVPVNGLMYAEGDTIDGVDVVYVGSDLTAAMTGLTEDTVYYYLIYSGNGVTGKESWNQTSPLSNSQSTDVPTPITLIFTGDDFYKRTTTLPLSWTWKFGVWFKGDDVDFNWLGFAGDQLTEFQVMELKTTVARQLTLATKNNANDDSGTYQSGTLMAGQYHEVKIVKTGNRFQVYLSGSLVFDDTLSGTVSAYSEGGIGKIHDTAFNPSWRIPAGYRLKSISGDLHFRSAYQDTGGVTAAAIGDSVALLMTNLTNFQQTGASSLYARRIAETLDSEPTANATSMTFTNVTGTTITVNWVAASPAPLKYLVLRKTSAFTSADLPIDGLVYQVGDTIGSATVKQIGTGLSLADTGLTAGVTYYYAVISMNGAAGYENYLTSAYLTDSQQATASYYALTFDGGDGMQTAANDTALSGLTAFTAAAWVKVSSTGDDFGRFFDKGTANGNRIIFCVGGSGLGSRRALFAGIGNGSSLITAYKGTVLTYDQLHHIAVSFAPGVVKLYVDGVLLTGLTTSGTIPSALPSVSTQISGGYNKTNGNQRHNGYLNNVAMWARVLTDANVLAEYQKGQNGTPDGTNLIHHWAMNEGTGTNVDNTGSTGNDFVFDGGSANPTWVVAS